LNSDAPPAPSRVASIVVAVLVAAGATSCFPELPNEYEITNLRVLALKADPANLRLDQWPLPPITMKALVVDPTDEALEGVEHTWALELPDDFEGAEELEELIPDGPYGPTLEVDLAALFGARETTWTQGLLPLRYTAADDELTREAIKFAYFLVPEIDLGDDDDSAGDDDDSAGDDDDSAGDDDDSAGDDDDLPDPPAEGEEELPESYNENPTLVSLTVGTTTFSIEAGTLPGEAGPLYVGAVDREDGLRFEIEVADDKTASDVDAQVYWTHGSPGLPADSPFADVEGAPKTDDDDDDESSNPYGSESASLNTAFFTPDREFGWTPPSESPPATEPIRLFLILVDDDGGQSWQEIRPADAP